MSKAKWPYQFKVQNKNMSQQTEISFPLLQIQTFHTDKKKKKIIHSLSKEPLKALKILSFVPATSLFETYSKEIF